MNRQQDQLSEWRKSKVVKGVKITSAQDNRACPECQKLHGQKFNLNKIPPLPVPNCQNPDGCRCVYLPVIDD